MDKVSIVIPCYYEEKSLPFFYKEINKITKEMVSVEFEIIFVNDGSIDKTLDIMKDYAHIDKRVKYISLSRNFGKESALYAGLENSTGDFIAVMDADLQDPPELLKQMYDVLINEDYDCVATRRVNRKGEPPIRSFFAKCFYKIINKISNADIVDGARDFRLMRRSVVDAILQMKEYNRFSKGIFGWVGFNTKWLAYENVERIAGETKWSFWKLFRYSIEGIIAFSTVPLVISSFIGLIFFIISLIMICFIMARTFIHGDPVAGWPSLVCIIFFVSGIQLFSTGILGQYLAKAYMETKNRPIYIIKESNLE
ncbi:glucosyl transferase family 2 [Clostridium beijerinckii]|uniref:Glycosyltransferase family 2 protein n=1 Tax=Clostridium beijerinckii TaxID=1520 RepID=A0AB74VF95_CLOBE|nr:glycosyltransferase family 2 protein [Clostridium beijerinckii]NRZ29273.1 glycosyltransferase involved in cell wall biosynthesis [Clostridium beijerinckii]NYB94957.1 glycosyltransferase involved in cell wall biosynthesis [Clostridium beijerinckii]OOM25740.1 putative glycosyltransferase CsbB [Clostridium beijerinckii]QUN34914.1 glycosyltransferase family 2 protein [Clostridium beijerinckii]SQB00104.1 Glycosyltransferases involved in cell wall biogenesis [Clostridium beijerinckii]